MHEKIWITSDASRLDVKMIYDFLKDAYWSKGRSLEAVRNSIKYSACFGMFLDEKQIGFARVITDYTIYAHLMDVFVLDELRGNGYGKLLLDYIFYTSDLKDVPKWTLGTRDAHDLYRQYGFRVLSKPEIWMERRI